MESKLTKVTTSIIISPIDNIDLQNKEIINQELMEDIIVDRKSDITVFNLLTQQLEDVHLNKLNEQHHWYFKDGKLHKIVHILK